MLGVGEKFKGLVFLSGGRLIKKDAGELYFEIVKIADTFMKDGKRGNMEVIDCEEIDEEN